MTSVVQDHDQIKPPCVDLDDTNRIVELIKEIGEQERHFNTLTGTYKTMASTWLLAVFGGIGFVLANRIEPWLLYTAGIGIAGSVGILLLWIIDLCVYQRLLNAAFTEGLKIEERYIWLPRIRHVMVANVNTGSITTNLSWFYVLGVCAPLFIFDYCIGSYLLINFEIALTVGFMVSTGLLTFFLAYRIRFGSKEKRSEKPLKVNPEEIDVDKKFNKSQKIILVTVGPAVYLIVCIVIYASLTAKYDADTVKTISLKTNYDYLAPDGSEIRLLSAMASGSLAHCVLLPKGVSSAVQHRTVVEIWYILQGEGEIWREHNKVATVNRISPGASLTIPTHTKFQFRNTGADSLKILIVTMPPWPGSDEAIKVNDYWRTIEPDARFRK
ncbi:cupin domain-containing protein [Dyadobacter fanqingshengii]|uniref:Cupin domain-containing protein n=1 Tax=Dyadobacter fanqingshengii TaxID=2906443 RepID=A0A9X1P6Q9_9BACT|nr:cupin domain-containing protein [Dyadobacter fanqingshengii]MCF0039766.1 cupin domain-containing protein [Dyadobacter fanqingshengii]USJ38471.1 cupin domain-containing protein [Dyadobacter fanqingshengii]